MSTITINGLSCKLIITSLIILSLISNANSDGLGPSDEQLAAFRQEALDEHNKFRQNHTDTPKLEMDDALNKYALDHCNKISQNENGEIQYSSETERTNIGTLTGISGENIYKSLSLDFTNAGKTATQTWYSEKKYYDYANGRSPNNNDISHFSQVVWKSSLKVGFGLAVSPTGTYVCANYYPGGNIEGQYIANVKKL